VTSQAVNPNSRRGKKARKFQREEGATVSKGKPTRGGSLMNGFAEPSNMKSGVGGSCPTEENLCVVAEGKK